MKDQLKKYSTDPFGDSPEKQLTTGKIIDAKIIQGLLDAEKIGNSRYLEFVAERLVKGTDQKEQVSKGNHEPIRPLKLKKTDKRLE